MTQIKKTLSIAGIIALATVPAMAEIASTQYVQNIVSNIIPTSGTVGDVLKKTETGLEWAAAPSVPENVLTNNSDAENSLAIGNGAQATALHTIQLGEGTNNEKGTLKVGLMKYDMYGDAEGYENYTLLDPKGKIPAERISGLFENPMIVGTPVVDDDGKESDIRPGQILTINESGYAEWQNGVAGITVDDERIAIGEEAYASIDGIAIGGGTSAIDGGIAIGIGAKVETHDGGIQLGAGTNNDSYPTLKVGLYSSVADGNYTLLDTYGIIPYERFAPTPDTKCKASVGQKCALVVTWDGTKYSQSWEVVRSTSSGQ